MRKLALSLAGVVAVAPAAFADHTGETGLAGLAHMLTHSGHVGLYWVAGLLVAGFAVTKFARRKSNK